MSITITEVQLWTVLDRVGLNLILWVKIVLGWWTKYVLVWAGSVQLLYIQCDCYAKVA